MIIVGAGISGLLCGALNPGSVIYEAGPERGWDHKALFRCRRPDIGKVLGMPFKKVNINKGIWFDGCEVDSSINLSHMYSQKVSGRITGRSILDISPGIRYILPKNFIGLLQDRCKILWNSPFAFDNFNGPIISTIPLPNILSFLKQSNSTIHWGHKLIYANQIPIKNCDAYCTMYYPDPEFNTYRASITGDMLITEGVGELSQNELYQICDSLGIPFTRQLMNHVLNSTQSLGKIAPIDNRTREGFIIKMTIEYGIYSLGRFATWKPTVMLDDVLEDIYHIRKLIQGGAYAALKPQTNEDN